MIEQNKKRIGRKYKVEDDPYFKALSICQKSKPPLANIVEDVVEAIASGALSITATFEDKKRAVIFKK